MESDKASFAALFPAGDSGFAYPDWVCYHRRKGPGLSGGCPGWGFSKDNAAREETPG